MPEGMDKISARETVMAWLASPVGHRTQGGKHEVVDATWLKVLDNADDPDVLYDWIFSQGPGCILVTGKYSYSREHTYRLERGLDFEPLPQKLGSDMLRKLSGRESDPDASAASNRIVEVLGGLLLALSQTSAIVIQKHLTFEDSSRPSKTGTKKTRRIYMICMQVKGPPCVELEAHSWHSFGC